MAGLVIAAGGDGGDSDATTHENVEKWPFVVVVEALASGAVGAAAWRRFREVSPPNGDAAPVS